VKDFGGLAGGRYCLRIPLKTTRDRSIFHSRPQVDSRQYKNVIEFQLCVLLFADNFLDLFCNAKGKGTVQLRALDYLVKEIVQPNVKSAKLLRLHILQQPGLL
jgi:hypothetical protein